MHILNEHKRKIHKCNQCCNRYSTQEKLQIHEISVHEGEKSETLNTSVVQEKQKSYKCSECESSFSEKHILEKHVKSVHEEIVPNSMFKCEICQKTFPDVQMLSLHLEKDHKGKIVKYR